MRQMHRRLPAHAEIFKRGRECAEILNGGVNITQYRKASIEDIDKLAALRILFLCEANHVDTEDEKMKLFESNQLFFQKGLSDGSFSAFVAVADDEIIATSGLSFYNLPPNKKCMDGKVAYISNMYTVPEYRQTGIASKLFSLAVHEAVSLGYKLIQLNATDMGRPIYEKFGFKDAENGMIYFTE